MTKKTILSSNQIHRLHHSFYEPQGEPIACLLIVHGMSEHSGRYEKFASFLADRGVLVVAYDQLGHGRTVKDKYELGFFDEQYPIQTLSKDVILMANALKSRAKSLTNKKIPCILMGHSMGSFLVRTVLTHHATSFDGVILMGTSNSFNIYNKIGFAQLMFLNKIRPKKVNLPLAAVINQYLLNKIASPVSASPFAWIAESTDVIDDFEADPLCGFAFTNNGLYVLQLLMKKAISSAWYQHLSPTFPILLVSGKDDPVGNMGQDIDELCDELLKNNKTCTAILYSNMRHEILHERGNGRVFGDILHWIKGVKEMD